MRPEEKAPCRRRMTIITTLVTTALLVAVALQVQLAGLAASTAVVVGVWLARYWRRQPCYALAIPTPNLHEHSGRNPNQ